MHRYDLENESWKLEWIILRWWAPENQTENTTEMVRVGEKNSHNRKQLWEDGNTLELRIFERMDKIEEKLFFGLQMLRMMTRNTTMNCWGTPEWKLEMLNQRLKEFENNLGEGIWLMTIHSYVKLWKEFENNSEKLEESGKILGKYLWVRAHSKETPLKWLLENEIAPVELNGLNEVTTSI